MPLALLMGMHLRLAAKDGQTIDPEPRGALYVYAVGLCYCSVCTDIEDLGELTARLNEVQPAGTQGGWRKAHKPFKGGLPNPCPCDEDPSRRHYLFEC
jgi:hypothetical protein